MMIFRYASYRLSCQYRVYLQSFVGYKPISFYFLPLNQLLSNGNSI